MLYYDNLQVGKYITIGLLTRLLVGVLTHLRWQVASIHSELIAVVLF